MKKIIQGEQFELEYKLTDKGSGTVLTDSNTESVYITALGVKKRARYDNATQTWKHLLLEEETKKAYVGDNYFVQIEIHLSGDPEVIRITKVERLQIEKSENVRCQYD